jgi:hypothetical protein
MFNCDDDKTSVTALMTSKSLDCLIFQAFNAPEDDISTLTFNKGCRLTDVEIDGRRPRNVGSSMEAGPRRRYVEIPVETTLDRRTELSLKTKGAEAAATVRVPSMGSLSTR